VSDDFVATPPDFWQTADPARLRQANRVVAQRRRKTRKQDLAEQAQEQRRDIHGSG
jgi:hypothetical protein